MNSKKTIIFFSRMGLTHLFGSIDKHLNSNFNIVHIAYSNKESQILKQEYGITPKYVLTEYLAKEIDSITINLEILQTIEADFLKNSENRFTLAGAIVSDRTLEKYSQEEVYKLSIFYYGFWKRIYENYNPSFIFHETVTQLYNHTASILAKKYNCLYSGFIATTGIYDNNFKFVEYDTGDSLLLSKLLKSNEISIHDNDNVLQFIEKTRSKKSVLTKYQESNILNDCFLLIRFFITSTIRYMLLAKKIKKNDPGRYYGITNFYSVKKVLNRIKYKYKVKYDEASLENYYYFALHVEPEAVLAYWADGKYAQIDLIEQIARRIPAGEFLYVKDHKDELGYRDIGDYIKISKLHNVKLLHPATDSLDLIKKSKGVITINGTVGLEASFFNIPVCMFGNIYYKRLDNVFFANCLQDISKFFATANAIKNTNLDAFLNAYLKSNFEGNLRTYFRCFKKCHNETENVNKIAESFKQYIALM